MHSFSKTHNWTACKISMLPSSWLYAHCAANRICCRWSIYRRSFMSITRLVSSMFECFRWPTIGNGVHENNALSTLVVCCGYILEPILASCVPNGHFESNVTNLKNFHLKVNSNGGSVDSSELLLSKSKENIGFSNCGISNDYNFDHIVIIIHPEKNIVLTAC